MRQVSDKEKHALAAAYAGLKEKLAALSEKEKEMKALKAQLEERLLDTLTDDVESYRTEHGTVSNYEKEFFTMDQPKLVHRYADETKDYGIFAKSVNGDFCKAYREEHGELPPGITSSTKRYLSFTKPRKQLPSR
jgi:hypothetical protein